MESPAPILLGLGVVAVLVLGSLLATGIISEISGTGAVSTSASHAQAPQPAAKPATHPG